ncbi:hypothetical protein Bbelb_321380 [Branchiostoma belcheri]|nr:hypothetical protein Bbelb_321380 [Branchiostoma belcheri]
MSASEDDRANGASTERRASINKKLALLRWAKPWEKLMHADREDNEHTSFGAHLASDSVAAPEANKAPSSGVDVPGQMEAPHASRDRDGQPLKSNARDGKKGDYLAEAWRVQTACVFRERFSSHAIRAPDKTNPGFLQAKRQTQDLLNTKNNGYSEGNFVLQDPR